MAKQNSKVPAVTTDGDGQVMIAAGRYARNAVLATFENIGGVDRMTEVADEDPKWFFEKLFSKVITREIEDKKVEETIDDILDELDKDVENAVDAEFEDV